MKEYQVYKVKELYVISALYKRLSLCPSNVFEKSKDSKSLDEWICGEVLQDSKGGVFFKGFQGEVVWEYWRASEGFETRPGYLTKSLLTHLRSNLGPCEPPPLI